MNNEPMRHEFTITPDFILQAQKAVWAPMAVRKELQANGFNVVPANFYAATPTISEIAASFEYALGDPPYLDPDIFDAETMRAWLAGLVPYSSDFAPSVDGDKDSGVYFWENGQFSHSDAAAYYAILRKVQPRRVVEIGGGFSTLVAKEALGAGRAGAITCIEPYPREFLRASGVDLLQTRAQDVHELNSILSDGDVLFIDSTHTVKTGSDCMHIYLRLLPSIRRRIYIHVHDVFLPFGMPRWWLEDYQIHWTEQYLLLAWLIDNQRTKVLYGSTYHQRFNPELLDQLMHGQYAAGGSSFWLEYDGRRE